MKRYISAVLFAAFALRAIAAEYSTPTELVNEPEKPSENTDDGRYRDFHFIAPPQ
jgi:hypothetical protein